MADISDISAAMLTIANGAVYPNGTGQPSVTSAPVKLFEGWPNADALNTDIAAGTANVSIFPLASAGAQVFQILNEPYIITPPAYGLTPTLSGQKITLNGTPTNGEFLTVIADYRHIYSRNGASATAICSALATDAQADYPSASASGNTLTIPAQDFTLRLGAPATMGQVTHRQRQTVIITVWAPDPATRNTLASAIDVVMKENLRITMPDTSQAVLTYDRTIITDSWEAMTVYRRDLYYTVEYATLEQWIAYVVTSVTTTWQSEDDYVGGSLAPPVSTVN